MKKKLFGLLFFLSIFVLTGCSKWIDKGQAITAVGSSALQPLVETVGEEFQGKNPGKFVNVQGGGSGTGLSQVQSGAVNIGNSDLFAEEKKGIEATNLIDHQVAVVGIAPIVNKEVGLKDISLKNLKDIFTGKITNWQEIGGKNMPVVLLNRANGSGTRMTFEKWVMEGQSAASAQEQDSTGMVRQIVATTPGAVSYMAFSYITDEVIKLSIDGIDATDENVMSNKWKIWSYEHMYTKKEMDTLTKEFLDFMLSDEVQEKIVGELGYIPVSKMQVKRDWKGNLIS